MMELEEGYRFHPTDSELLTFLLRFLVEQPLHDDVFITKLDVYQYEPWVTYKNGRHCGGEDDDGDTSIWRYFITPRHKKKKESKKFSRGVAGDVGTWKGQDKGKMVTTTTKEKKALIIGCKKSLSYDSSSCPDDGKWLMKEYTFCETILKKFENSEFRDYAICAIKKKCRKSSSDGSGSSNVSTIMDFSDEEKVDTMVISGVDQPRMDQEYNAITPINVGEPMMEFQEDNDHVLGLTTTISQIQESNYGMINSTFENSYGNMITPPIDLVVELDHLKAATEWNGNFDFENPVPEINLPEEPARVLQEGCTFGTVNENHIAYQELESNHPTSFVELLSGGSDSTIRNNQVQIQDAPREENDQLEPMINLQIQEPVIPDFANAKSKINWPEICDNMAEYMGVDMLMNPDDELMATPFNFFEQPTVESTQPQVQNQEVAVEENGPLGLTAPSSQIQEFVMPENNAPEIFDMVDAPLEKNQTQHQPTPQEESETLCETEESHVVVDLSDLFDHAPMKDRLDAIRESKSTLISDQQSWQSKAHLQDMLLGRIGTS